MKKFILLVLLTSILSSDLLPKYSKKDQKLTVLLYHDILPDNELEDENDFIIGTENFKSHMTYLNDNGYKTITLDELKRFLFEKEPIPQKSVLITFDDGYYNNIAYAYPVLKEFNFNAVIFLISETLEKKSSTWQNVNDYITIEQMDKSKDVFEFASHTHALHEFSNGKSLLLNANQNEIINDLNKSITFFENSFAFSYPHGQYNDAVIEALKDTSIEMAFTITDGYITKNSDPLTLNRYTIYRPYTVDKIEKILQGSNNYVN